MACNELLHSESTQAMECVACDGDLAGKEILKSQKQRQEVYTSKQSCILNGTKTRSAPSIKINHRSRVYLALHSSIFILNLNNLDRQPKKKKCTVLFVFATCKMLKNHSSPSQLPGCCTVKFSFCRHISCLYKHSLSYVVPFDEQTGSW